MAQSPEMEKRITALEMEVAELSALLRRKRQPGEDWLTPLIGSMAKYPEFEEVVRLGKEWRDSFKPDEEPPEEIDESKRLQTGERKPRKRELKAKKPGNRRRIGRATG